MLVHFVHHYGLRGLVRIGFKTQIPPDLTPQVKILHVGAAFFGITGRFPKLARQHSRPRSRAMRDVENSGDSFAIIS